MEYTIDFDINKKHSSEWSPSELGKSFQKLVYIYFETEVSITALGQCGVLIYSFIPAQFQRFIIMNLPKA